MSNLNYNYSKGRFEAFIDATIAIILTILILELRIPESEHDVSTKKQLVSLLPSFVSYIGSFLLIVGIWLDHHLLFLNLLRLTRGYILLNMLFILSLSIVPFTTAFAGHHNDDSFAVALLFTNYIVMNIFFGMLYWFANSKKLLEPEFFADNKYTALYSVIGMIGLLAAIPLAYVDTRISFIIGIVIFGGHLFKPR